MTRQENLDSLDFSFNGDNLYKEEIFSEMEAGSIRRMLPVTPNGDPDTSRAPIYLGSLQLMTPEGPLPIQAHLPANNLKEAMAVFPATMKAAVESLMEEVEKMARENRKEKDSRIIVPGMDLR